MTTGRSLRFGEALLGGLVLALGLFIIVETFILRLPPTQATVGPKLFPYLVAGGLVVIGLLVLREAIFGHIAHDRGFELDWPAVALVSAGLIAQLLLIEGAGWIVAATLVFAATARAFGSRRLTVDLLIGLALASLAFVAFNYGLGLDLPLGEWLEDVVG